MLLACHMPLDCAGKQEASCHLLRAGYCGLVARKENVLENDAEPSKGAHVLWISGVDSAPLQRSWGSRSRNAETPHHCATEIKVTLT